MKSQTSLVAQQTRLSEWAEQIRECNARPQGMTVGDWCQSQGITKANYYWRLRKVREALLEAGDVTPVFVELPAPAAPVKEPVSAKSEVAAILKFENHAALEITNEASPAFLTALFKAMHHAQ